MNSVRSYFREKDAGSFSECARRSSFNSNHTSAECRTAAIANFGGNPALPANVQSLSNFKMKSRRALTLSLAALFLGTNFLFAAEDPLAWPPITSETKPWAWWWWHGSAVDETNLAHELQRFHDAGLGGVQVTTIYGVKGAEARDVNYLTPRWLDLMGATVDDAKKLDMGVTMSLGSGWCFGGPTVSDEDANASVVAKTFSVNAGEKLSQKFNRKSTQALVAFSPDGKSIELTDKISEDGSVDWTAPADSTNAWTVYAISQKPSGQKVKRPAPGGEGWMLNPAYPQAMTNWLTWFNAALKNYSGSKPLAVFQDSYEYKTDWSPDFFAQFEKRRGYQLQTELPALFGDEQNDHVARVKYDYRRTLAEIMAEQSEPAWIDWAHRNGFSTIYQAHGTPGNWLDLYAAADMPETEMFHNDRSILISKFASSAAHVAGHQLTGAETGTWLKEHFTETLADVKYLADDMFLAGVNRIFYHGTCYSPDDAPWPGWLFYASTEMNPRNPIWHDVDAVNNYITRVQSVLQSGKPDNDILLYWPVADFWSNPAGRVQPMGVSTGGWFEEQNIGKTAHELWNRGYAFDYVSDAQLQTAKVADGKIQMQGGEYKVIVVPECKFMPLETLNQLLSLAKQGAKLVFCKLPRRVSGYSELEKRSREFETLLNIPSRHGFSGATALHIPFGKGEIIQGNGEPVLPATIVVPEMISSYGLSYIRRSFDGGWNYFIANRGDKNFDGLITLARPAKAVEILDPLTGSLGRTEQNETGQIHLQLAAGQSLIVRAFDHVPLVFATPALWTYFQTNGTPTEISGAWNVKFISGGPTLPVDSQISKLASWTTFTDTNAQAFAGTAKYEVTFDAPKSGAKNCFLDLGDVRQSARLKLNGKDYGTLIIPPFRVVVDNLQPTGNKLEVEVTSVAANRVRDLDRRGVNWKIFKDINIVNVNYKPFDAADWPLTDCGLLGPVTLTQVAAGK
jgi:alpha-L-rhamnosidase